MPLYSIYATVNYTDDECDTPQSSDCDIDNIRSWIAKLLETEPDATSFLVIITPKAKD